MTIFANSNIDMKALCQDLAEALKKEYSWIAPDKLFALFIDTSTEQGTANTDLNSTLYQSRQLVTVLPVWSIKIALMLNYPICDPITGAPWYVRSSSPGQTNISEVENLMEGLADWIMSTIPQGELLQMLDMHGGYLVTSLQDKDLPGVPENTSYQ